jgi:hypothetical protein
MKDFINYKQLMKQFRLCPRYQSAECTNIPTLTSIFDQQTPVVMSNLVDCWPAISDESRRWSNLKNLANRTREKYPVPVEIGGNYMNIQGKVSHIDFASFLDFLDASINTSRDHNSKREHLYVAQCYLNEMDELLKDVQTPDLCLHTGKKTLYRRNLWFSGLDGAESPCHYDPFHNVLCQVIGTKQVLLFPHIQHDNLYPAVGTSQKNTSLIDFLNLDLNKYPNIFEAMKHGTYAILKPGDALFIPKKYWHYCISEELSCSVNFWWL